MKNKDDSIQTASAETAGSSENDKKKDPADLKKAILSLIFKIAFVGIILFILLTFVGGIYICHTNDMYPSVRDGDLLITFKLGKYHEGDVIAYKYDDEICFGRIIGEPGDSIEIDDEGNLYVNGTIKYETIYYQTLPREDSMISYPYTINSGEFFVLSDMREQGFDSRVFGGVTDVKGKAVLQLRRRGF